MADKQLIPKEIPLTGRLITSRDPATIDDNFRQLTNIRYKESGVEAVKGHTQINTTALADAAGPTNYFHIQNGFHFRKSVPSNESHIVVQATKTDDTVPKLFTNDTAIPNQGDFTTTQIYTEDSSAGVGVFTEAPDGFMAYTNGKETLAWGGTEARCARFIRFDPNDNTKKWDYTKQITNTLTSDIATMVKSGGALDANNVLLLHLDNNVTDSGGTTHTVTNNNVTFSTTAKFGTHSGSFNGTNAYLTVPDHADFDLSGGVFTMDCWINYTSIAFDHTIYYQETDDNNYTRLWLDFGSAGGARTLYFDIYATGAAVVQLTSATDAVIASTWTHIAIVENGNNYYMFIDGSLVDSTSDVNRAANDTGLVHIGWDNNAGLNNKFNGLIDEFRILNGTAKWTSNFTPPAVAYPINSAEVYIGSILPIQGAKFYIGTANTDTSGTASAQEWDGTDWSALTITADGTATGGAILAQDGSITFASTATTAKVRSIDSISLYWYKFNFPGVDDTTTVYQVTLDIPTQLLKDIWDGEFRTVLAFMEWDNSGAKFYDHTIGVFEDYYDSADSGTRAKLEQATGSTWVVASDYLLLASAERLSGFNFNMVSPQENTVTASMTISYWDGDSFVDVGTINDNTLETGKTLAKSGIVTWNPPASTLEFTRMDLSVRRKAPEKKTGIRREEDEGELVRETEYQYWGSKADQRLADDIAKRPFDLKQFGYPLYFYKITFNGQIAAASNNVEIFHIGCIPAQTDIRGYSYCSMHQDRLFLSDDTVQHGNSEICSAANTTNVFNGYDSRKFRYGGESKVTCGVSLSVRYKDGLNSVRAVFKKDETHLLTGYSSQTWRKVQISETKGCVAPLTAQACDITVNEVVTQVVIFQSANGIHLFDGKVVIDIDRDIEDVFKPESTTKVNTSVIDKNVGFYDPHKQEYHWLWASGSSTTLDKEYVFNVSKFQWNDIDRSTGAYLQCGFPVQDTTGNTHIYGGIDTGHLMRLENGTSFAKTTGSNDITHTMWLGDMAISEGSITVETKLRYLNLVGVAKETTSNEITVTHYEDGITTGVALDNTISMSNSGNRLYNVVQSLSRTAVFHGLKFVATTNDETIGFEPLYVTMLYSIERQKVRGD